MVRYLILLLISFFIGCEMNGQQIIKPEKLNFDVIKFNTVSKNLIIEADELNSEIKDMKKIITYWFDNKIKTDGFDGSLSVSVKTIDTNKIKKKDYFQFSISILLEFEEKSGDLNRKKTYKINSSEYGEISGNFSIKDQENLALNVMHQSLESISKKLFELNN